MVKGQSIASTTNSCMHYMLANCRRHNCIQITLSALSKCRSAVLPAMAFASIATGSLHDHEGQGHSRTVGGQPPLIVTINTKENAMHSDSSAVLLRVSNCLLFSWYQNNTVSSKYVLLANAVILDKVIQLKPESEDLLERLSNEHAQCLLLLPKI